MDNEGRYELVTAEQAGMALAERCRQLRLAREWKQSTLGIRAGVSLASVRRFEQTGQISLKSLLRLSAALGRLADFDTLFPPPRARSIRELEAMTSLESRKRGSR